MNARIDYEYRIARDRQEREREIQSFRAQQSSDRRAWIRRRIGESVIRFGERIAATPGPAWSR